MDKLSTASDCTVSTITSKNITRKRLETGAYDFAHYLRERHQTSKTTSLLSHILHNLTSFTEYEWVLWTAGSSCSTVTMLLQFLEIQQCWSELCMRGRLVQMLTKNHSIQEKRCIHIRRMSRCCNVVYLLDPIYMHQNHFQGNQPFKDWLRSITYQLLSILFIQNIRYPQPGDWCVNYNEASFPKHHLWIMGWNSARIDSSSTLTTTNVYLCPNGGNGNIKTMPSVCFHLEAGRLRHQLPPAGSQLLTGNRFLPSPFLAPFHAHSEMNRATHTPTSL